MAEMTEHIVDIDVSQEMRTSFLEYSYSVIYARALPDARDGLKPVQRRILFQMNQMGLRPDRGHVKSSRVIGDVMGRLHPHGDSAIYDAMVRMAQPFTMRLPLVDGHGNFGSLDDGPAAARYTEARMAPAALAMTASLDEDVVDMVPNYDNTLLQPEVLPAAIPNLLVNGSSGIAVGMATNMAPHNLNEVIAGAQHLLNHPDATLDELMKFIPGPDLPEGGRIVGLDGIRQAYETGRGIFRTRATAHIENITARKKGIVFSELPYLVGPEKVIEKIKDGVQNKKLTGIADVQNLTDRHHGMRLVVEVKASTSPEEVLAALYQHTPLEESFGINNVALVDGEPRTLGLRELLQVFIDHRISVTRRRSQFRLNKALERLHLVEGLLIAILDIDEVIQLIRSSEDSATAKTRLMEVFDLSEPQAEYILELRLRRLTKFSQIELEAERDELNKTIEELREILGSEVALKALITREMSEVAREYGTPRRTILLESDASSAAGGKPKKLADDPAWVLLSTSGRVARVEGEEPISRMGNATHGALTSEVLTSNLAEVGVVSSGGTVARLRVGDIPALPRTENAPSLEAGAPIDEIVLLPPSETVVGLISLDPDVVVAVATEQGKVKRTNAADAAAAGSLITLLDDDVVIGVAQAPDNHDLALVTSDAQLLRFSAADVRPQGHAGRGIAGMRVSDGARVIALGSLPSNDLAAHVVATISGSSDALPGTVAGHVKVTPLDRYPAKGRATGGVRTHRFLRGENVLQLAWIGPMPARAVDSRGKSVPLPEVDERRDGSGEPAARAIVAIG
ncbi:DNA gyrase subunit A [Arcanobacterium wilhelmae]|uniref:DNA topoisomerase (ATP-hydrolyzing) n=1 Tax=Arcanobacterium wilhelmae TaxID=1803177 RepID=A0ABT9N9S6_9ACTO|nr:DNA topoisomerase IV subunit A [Arcanobacterium wilhelmae]MDP9800161.1 DNA gyrase subunit A [Arcanobacterium wilhelmae]WFN89601.1 DNA topoisomerase IV subunit A [Arcanobacterium wilhelmae]